MNPEISPIPRELRAEAAAWVARLHSCVRTPALEAGFRRWLKSSAMNARAFELATEAWDIAGGIPANALPRIAHPSGLRTRRTKSWRSLFFSGPSLAVTAILSLAIGAAVMYEKAAISVVSTGTGEQRMLTLRDGTHLFLNTQTRLHVKYDKTKRLIELVSGEAMFDVAEDPKRPFMVSVGDKQILALGTSFIVRRDQHETVVTLMQGKVQVNTQPVEEGTGKHPARENQSEILTPGQQVTFIGHRPPELDRPPLEQVLAWRRGEVVLDRTRLQDAAEELNRYSETKLVIVDPAAADIRISGIFRAGDSVRFAQAVAATYHLHVEYQGSEISISGLQAP